MSKKRKILVVDDERHQLDTVCRGLFIYGYDCCCALNAEDALNILDGPNGTTIDLVLTDLTMPGDSGLVLIEEIRGRRLDLPIIVFTGLAASREVETVRKTGIRVLSKPFEPNDLDIAIRSTLSE